MPSGAALRTFGSSSEGLGGAEPAKLRNWLMTKEIRLNACDMNCVGHIQHGMWTHPRDRSTEYNTIEY
jgi:hypothetical protein